METTNPNFLPEKLNIVTRLNKKWDEVEEPKRFLYFVCIMILTLLIGFLINPVWGQFITVPFLLLFRLPYYFKYIKK